MVAHLDAGADEQGGVSRRGGIAFITQHSRSGLGAAGRVAAAGDPREGVAAALRLAGPASGRIFGGVKALNIGIGNEVYEGRAQAKTHGITRGRTDLAEVEVAVRAILQEGGGIGAGVDFGAACFLAEMGGVDIPVRGGGAARAVDIQLVRRSVGIAVTAAGIDAVNQQAGAGDRVFVGAGLLAELHHIVLVWVVGVNAEALSCG